MLELFAGCGSHSSVVAAVLSENLKYPGSQRVRVTRLTVDNDARLEPRPGLVADLRVWRREHTAALLDVYPNKRFVVHASPPCQAYSVANTTSETSLEELMNEADPLVRAPLFIYQDLCDMGNRALALTVENPGTGRLVGRDVSGCSRVSGTCPPRAPHAAVPHCKRVDTPDASSATVPAHVCVHAQVIAPLGEPVIVDYCQYGGLRRKRWASGGRKRWALERRW